MASAMVGARAYLAIAAVLGVQGVGASSSSMLLACTQRSECALFTWAMGEGTQEGSEANRLRQKRPLLASSHSTPHLRDPSFRAERPALCLCAKRRDAQSRNLSSLSPSAPP